MLQIYTLFSFDCKVTNWYILILKARMNDYMSVEDLGNLVTKDRRGVRTTYLADDFHYKCLMLV